VSGMAVRYDDFNDFYAKNTDAFQSLLTARNHMKSRQELALTGEALIEAERLSYVFLNFASLCSELRFGLVASVYDAKQAYKNASAQFMRSSDEKSVKAKELMLFADEVYEKQVKRYNDLFDLNEYLEKRYADFEKAHYYYKAIAGARNG